jgi:hypothetical protein
MKKLVFTALAVLGIVLGTVSLTTPANAYYSFAPPAMNAGSNS